MKDAAIKNYIRIGRFSLWYAYYAIIDVPEYYGDQLFIQQQVTVEFGAEYAHNDSPYLVIFCKVRKKDESKFLKALAELPRKMLLCGYTDYNHYCQSFIQKMESGREQLRGKRYKQIS